jgi:hypothetical protein
MDESANNASNIGVDFRDFMRDVEEGLRNMIKQTVSQPETLQQQWAGKTTDCERVLVHACMYGYLHAYIVCVLCFYPTPTNTALRSVHGRD